MQLSQLEKEVEEMLRLLDRKSSWTKIFKFIYIKQKISLKEPLVKLSRIQK